MAIDNDAEKIRELQEDIERAVREMNDHLKDIKDAVLALTAVVEKILVEVERS